jgi:type IV pilus assembly protein PilY1
MVIGRVKIGGNETWVGFIGGGFNSNSGDSNQGRGFFVVQLSNGSILWSYTRGNDTTMTYSLPGSPAIVDTDNDGFVDTAYIGDLGGNIWRFNFCTGADGNGCGTSNWSGGKLFQSSTAMPIFTTPSAGRGSGSELWVFWGSGDKENPTAKTTHDSFFAVKDPDRTSTYTLGQLQDISGSVFDYAHPGWRIGLADGEKVLSDSAAFGGMITWTTYTPWDGADPCGQTGASKLYALAMMPIAIGGVTYQPGAGLFADGARSMVLGPGIAQVPIFSQKPGGSGPTDVYISTSGGGGADTSVVSAAGMGETPFKERLQDTVPSARLLHWLDQRIVH